MSIDYLIIGQGVCGTFLTRALLKAGKTVLVMDNNQPFTASKVASGVVNPVTGRRIVRTWMIEELLPFAQKEYVLFGKELNLDLVKKCSVLDFHPSLQMKEAFEKRLTEEQEFLHQVEATGWNQTFRYHFGVGEISPCLLIDINSLITSYRAELENKDLLLQETFKPEFLTVADNQITYNDIVAEKIIFCDGVNGIQNAFFKNLPYSPNKGEAIIARIPGLSDANIYKQGLSIVPWKEDLFWIGSTYEWDFKDASPSSLFKERVNSFLSYFLKLPFEIVDHIASVRPANMERRPFVGLHPKFLNVSILNGMGTKGCSLAPYFAQQLADLLTTQKPISPEADVSRFKKILERQMN